MTFAQFCERFPKYVLEAPSWPLKKQASSISKDWVKKLDLTHVELLYIFGLGDGSIYSHLREWLHEKSNRRIVFFEEDPTVVAALLDTGTILFSDLQVDFELLVSDTIDRFAIKYPVNRVEVICLPEKNDFRFRKNRLILLRKTALSNALFVDRLFGYRLFDNFRKNVPRLQGAFYANGLKDAFSEMPVIVCGAGPSLQEAIPLLRNLEGRALVIAGGSAIAALSAQGIEPHFGIAVDPNKEEYHRFCNSFFFEGPLLLSTRVFPGIFGTCNGPFGYLRSETGGASELWFEKEIGLTDPLLTNHMPEESTCVITLALAFAVHIGAKTITLAGMDLAYTGGKRYAEGVCSDNAKQAHLSLQGLDLPLRRKGKTGKSLSTALRWVMESAAIEKFAKKHPGVRWINATKEGLSIKGFQECSLEAAYALYMNKSFDIRGKIAKEIALHPMPTIPHDLLQKLDDSLLRTIDHLTILANQKTGSKALAQLELEEELAVQVLFSDMPWILEQAERLNLSNLGFALYLEIAQRYSGLTH